ncbi:copper chaperone PCu(A)C [Massilia glaciei]|uniref:Copper chaperone PCu(A)C n=1 Tax=Massilia glaciei TaxID=1524097 RepID=A0A2U2HM68_9BURK|nr:copper chaperone PCu(A)C [Massilia glaciei]PWF48569.1 copper chaperone PCu(A)C [Massilia glaciei]
MNKFVSGMAAMLALAGSAAAQAQVKLSAPWVRATVPQQSSTGAFLRIETTADARLVKVASPVAGIAEMHKMEMKGEMMRMYRVDGIALPAGKVTQLASGGHHIMLLDLKRQLKAGETVPLTLTFEDRQKKRSSVTLAVPVKPLTYVSPAKAH